MDQVSGRDFSYGPGSRGLLLCTRSQGAAHMDQGIFLQTTSQGFYCNTPGLGVGAPHTDKVLGVGGAPPVDRVRDGGFSYGPGPRRLLLRTRSQGVLPTTNLQGTSSSSLFQTHHLVGEAGKGSHEGEVREREG